MGIARLNPRERVVLDDRPIEDLCALMGFDRAEALVATAMEELAVWMSRSEKLRRAGNRDELARLARQAATVGGKLGMPQLARVGQQVADLAPHADEATLAAVAARMARLGEGSLVAVWDLQGQSL
jgi:hypothetical protein